MAPASAGVPAGLEIAPARAEERDVLANLVQLYVHDFSEQWAGTARGELGDDGRFAAYPLDAYWREPARIPLLFRVGGHLAGFALINDHAHSGRPAARNMAEFFIVRKHRREGIGLAAARMIFRRYPGQWEVAVARTNPSALAFWRKTVCEAGFARELEEFETDGPAWDGTILRFRVAD